MGIKVGWNKVHMAHGPTHATTRRHIEGIFCRRQPECFRFQSPDELLCQFKEYSGQQNMPLGLRIV